MKRLITIFALTATAAFAQPNEAHMKAAKELATTVGVDKQAEASFNSMLPMINNMAQRLQLNPADTTELQGIYKAWLTEDLDQKKLIDNIVSVYAELYTEQELVDLNKFYQSPLGKKTLTTMPELTRRVTTTGSEEARSKQGKLQERLKPFIEKHPLPQAPGAPGAAPAPAPAPAPEPAKK